MSQKILIKDPYLNSTYKSEIPEKYHHFQKPRLYHQAGQQQLPHRKIDHELRYELERTQNQYKRIAKAYNQENRLNRKILDFQAVNTDYHQALKIRNFDLNNKLADLNTQNHLLSTKFQTDQYRNYHQKDVIIKKYETQAEELLQARKTINNLLENKTRLQQQLQELTFFLDTETEKFNLDMREQMIRMEGLERSLKNLAEIKDQQINQLRNRIRIYEDQNKRLNEENRSLHTNASQRDKENKGGIQNLSQINYMDSQMKDPTIQKQLQEQKNLNDRLLKEMEDMKRKLFSIQQEQNKRKEVSPKKRTQGQEQQSVNNTSKKLETDRIEGIMGSINSLRNGMNKQIFEVFYKSVKDGQKHRSNSLVIFIQNWKNIDLDRMIPYIQSYMQSRSTLKQICLSNKYQGRPIQVRMEECIPLHIALKKGRNQINSWILSTIQLTKNQRQSSKRSMNNLLLFLFRLLTIQYRITYPMQGKSYTIDEDVKNELAHQIIKAIQYIIDFK